MNIFKKLFLLYLKKNHSLEYAKFLGVKFPGGGVGCRLLSMNFDTEPWLISIGNHVELSGNVTFITHDGATWVFRDHEKYKNVIRYGTIVIEDNCFIGKNAVILPGITIGKNSIIGAGSIVTKDIPSNSVVAGNPAHLISSTSEYAEKCLRESPNYDVDAYIKNKRTVIEKIFYLDSVKKTKR